MKLGLGVQSRLGSARRSGGGFRVARCDTPARSTLYAPRSTAARAFTLIELMVVIGIMAIVMTMSAPAIYHIWHKESIRKSVQDVTEACEQARSLAIMRGNMAELVLHADGGKFEVRAGVPVRSEGDPASAAPAVTAAPVSAPGSAGALSGTLPDTVGIASLKVNGVNCMDIEEAHVRFFPNGTCDELRLVLLESKDGELRGIFTEVTTGLVSVESDKFKLQSELR